MNNLFSDDFNLKSVEKYFENPIDDKEQLNLIQNEASRIEKEIKISATNGEAYYDITVDHRINAKGVRLIVKELMRRFPQRICYQKELGKQFISVTDQDFPILNCYRLFLRFEFENKI
jgi:hypothetical protein